MASSSKFTGMASTSATPREEDEKLGALGRVMGMGSPSLIEDEIPIRYKKLEKIGDGASAAVYKGLRLDTKEFIAIKQVRSRPNEWEQEVAVFKKLSHPNIVRYLGTHRDGLALNILMEYAPGGSVSAQLKKVGCLPDELVRRYTKEMLQGLKFVHESSIVHRDIKGANLLLDEKGTVKLADFGASKIYLMGNPDGTRSADFLSLKGTLSWMAPEVVKMTGHGRKADVWSVGITVWEMLCGRPPYVFPNVNNGIYNIGNMERAPEAPAEMSPHARDFITLCLKLNAKERPSVRELLKHPFVMEVGEGSFVLRNVRLPTLEPIPSSLEQLSQEPPTPVMTQADDLDEPPRPKGCMPRLNFGRWWARRSEVLQAGSSASQTTESLPPSLPPSGELDQSGRSRMVALSAGQGDLYRDVLDTPSPEASPDGPLGSKIGPVAAKEQQTSSFASGIRPPPTGQFLRALPRFPPCREVPRKS